MNNISYVLNQLVVVRLTEIRLVALFKLGCLLSFLVLDLQAKPKMSHWHESINSRSGEKGYSFTIQDVGPLDSLHVKGLNTGKWTYLITLKGEGASKYSKNDVVINNPAALKSKGKEGMYMKIENGEISVDYRKNEIVIALRVWKGDAVVDFEGNGKYAIERGKI